MGRPLPNSINRPSRKSFLRFWALLLTFATLLSMPPVSVPAQAAEDPGLWITADGVQTDSVYITTRQKTELSVQGADDQAHYQWQILHPDSDDSWVTIYDAVKQSLSVTIALARNMLRSDGTVQLRCRVTENNIATYTHSITVHFTEPQAPAVILSQEPFRQDTVIGAEGDEIPEFVTITINYTRYDYARDDNGNLVTDGSGNLVLEEIGMAFMPYVATLKGGNSHNTVVANPTMVGYDAYLDGALSDSITLAFDSVTSDITYNVQYRPADVAYSVHYFMQNIYDDLYVENTGLLYNGTGKTGTTPPNDIMSKPVIGFTPLYYQPDSIAADGSTVFEVYYERDYYLMEFDCNGGYGAETLYVRYGSYISVPQPVKAGYVFAGWDLVKTDDPHNTTPLGNGIKDTLPETLPPYNTGYKAIWNTTETTYTIVFWAENADDGHYSYKTYKSVDALSNTALIPLTVARAQNLASVAGFTDASHFTLNEARTQLENPASVVVEGDGSTVINLYYSRKMYTLNFINNNASCSFEPHVHTDSCYEYYCPSHTHTASCYVCGKSEHAHDGKCCSITEHMYHTISCYTSGTQYTIVTSGDDQTRINKITNPVAGYVYRYRDDGWLTTTYYNYLYDGSTWYRLGTDDDYENVTHGNIGNPREDEYTSAAATMICTMPLHTHGIGCNYVCGTEPHAHSAACLICNSAEHTHGGDCCSVSPHTHSITCYNPSAGYRPAVSGDTGYTTLAAIANPQTGYVYKYRSSSYSYHNYFYDGDKWYYLGTGSSYRGLINSLDNPTINGRYTFAKATKEISCGQAEHDHTSGCNHSACTTPIHTHTGDCFLCGEHHVHTALCDRHKTCLLTEHVHTGNCHLVYSITAKYDADISAIWENDPILSLAEKGIVWRSSVTSQYYSFLEKMPSQNIDLTYTEWSGYTYTWYYYLEVGPNENIPDSQKYQPGDGRTYKLYHTTKLNGSSDLRLTYEEDYFPITGYTQRDKSVPSFSNRTAYLFYTINSWQLEYYNYSADGPTPTKKTLTFGDPLAPHNIPKETMQESYYPKNLEPSAYEFGGWYTSPGCFDGSEVDWANGTMPDGNNIIYAKWTPILRNVTFYNYYSDIAAGCVLSCGQEHHAHTAGCYSCGNPEHTHTDACLSCGLTAHVHGDACCTLDHDHAVPFQEAKNVPHGHLLGSTYSQQPAAKPGYRFIGWFYMDEDNKKRFAPDSMEITRDLVLFAEWSTSIDTTYQVEYVLKEDVTADGVTYPAGTPIADMDFSHITVGKTKTFQAKGGTQLDVQFRSKYFPTTNSHSILMDEQGSKNTFRFEYIYDPEVYYKVRYVDYVTRTELAPSKIVKTDKSVVTEKFLPIQGYIPTGYYVTKALASDGDSDGSTIASSNVLTFYYVEDTLHGMFAIEHYLEDVDSTDHNNKDNYTLYESEVGSADINTTKTGVPRSYMGFQHNAGLNTVITYQENGVDSNGVPQFKEEITTALSGTVTYMGLTIQIYYSRQEYPYIIEYQEYGAPAGTPPLKRLDADGNPVTGTLPTKRFDEEVSFTAEKTFTLGETTYEYYLAGSTEEDRTKAMDIRATEGDGETPNKLIFYYTQKKIPVAYHRVCKDPNFSHLNTILSTESAPAPSGLGGTKAYPMSGFEFVGWYEDEACTVPVDSSWVDSAMENHLKPLHFTLEEGQDEDHYYALYRPVSRSLTIRKEGTDIRSGDSFLFQITGTDVLGEISPITVVVHGSGSVTVTGLYCGEYTVTELTDWSWTYSCAEAVKNASLTVSGEAEVTLTFTNDYQSPDWLTDETGKENKFN